MVTKHVEEWIKRNVSDAELRKLVPVSNIDELKVLLQRIYHDGYTSGLMRGSLLLQKEITNLRDGNDGL